MEASFKPLFVTTEPASDPNRFFVREYFLGLEEKTQKEKKQLIVQQKDQYVS